MENYSVLMTIYKKDNPIFVKQSIDSMLNQTVKTNDFVLVCDGTLTSELDTIVDEYNKNNEQIFNVVRLDKNIGLGGALRKGVGLCKNELIARMDDDDIALKNRCECELKIFEENQNLSILGSYVKEFDSNNSGFTRIKKVPLTQEGILEFSKRRNPFNHSTVMFKKSAVIDAGNYSEMRTNQDVELWVRMLNKGYIGMNIDEPLVNFRFDEKTYERRKDWKNVQLLINVWKDFKRKGYCSLGDLFFVELVQMAMFFLPKTIIRWSYDHFR